MSDDSNERIPTLKQLELTESGLKKTAGSGPEPRRRLIRLDHEQSQGLSGKQVLKALLVITLSMLLVADLSRLLRPLSRSKRGSLDSMQSGGSGSLAAPAWASWIGEVPTAAEMYGDASADMPTTESFDDDDEEPDEELDASASNEYPENDNDNENDESYEDQDENPDGAESRQSGSWLPSPSVATTAAPTGELEAAWRRSKRDLEDRLVLASRRDQRRQRNKKAAAASKDEDEFSVEDGDEDAWVHDGVDDIHIDPETKKAASELSYDERSIDAEYEPHGQKEPPVLNRTRITTIAEVIPMNDEANEEANERDSSKLDWRVLPAPALEQRRPAGSLAQAAFLPASYLTIEQAQKLIGQQHEQLEQQQRQLANQERQLAALSSEDSPPAAASR